MLVIVVRSLDAQEYLKSCCCSNDMPELLSGHKERVFFGNALA